jgi:hypothetical protein
LLSIQNPVLLPLPLCLPQPHAGAAAVFVLAALLGRKLLFHSLNQSINIGGKEIDVIVRELGVNLPQRRHGCDGNKLVHVVRWTGGMIGIVNLTRHTVLISELLVADPPTSAMLKILMLPLPSAPVLSSSIAVSVVYDLRK